LRKWKTTNAFGTVKASAFPWGWSPYKKSPPGESEGCGTEGDFLDIPNSVFYTPYVEMPFSLKSLVLLEDRRNTFTRLVPGGSGRLKEVHDVKCCEST